MAIACVCRRRPTRLAPWCLTSRNRELEPKAEHHDLSSNTSHASKHQRSHAQMMMAGVEKTTRLRTPTIGDSSRLEKGKHTADGNVAQNDTLPWVEKYRPQALDDVVAHDDVVATLRRFVREDTLPHLLFYGPPGTGKTSLILAVARELYGPAYRSMILELNASDDRGIDAVRTQIKVFASTQKIFSSGFKLVVLDEADAMTPAAQNALRRVIEKYTRNVRFCIVCNYVSKIIAPIQSRCTRFRFQALGDDQVGAVVDRVAIAENVSVSPAGRRALIALSEGDLRRTINVMQTANAAHDIIDEDAVYRCTGAPHPSDIATVLDTLLQHDYAQAHSTVTALMRSKALSLMDIVVQLLASLANHEMPAQVKAFLFDTLSELEYRLAKGCQERVQLAGLVGAFKIACELTLRASSKPT